MGRTGSLQFLRSDSTLILFIQHEFHDIISIRLCLELKLESVSFDVRIAAKTLYQRSLLPPIRFLPFPSLPSFNDLKLSKSIISVLYVVQKRTRLFDTLIARLSFRQSAATPTLAHAQYNPPAERVIVDNRNHISVSIYAYSLPLSGARHTESSHTTPAARTLHRAFNRLTHHAQASALVQTSRRLHQE